MDILTSRTKCPQLERKFEERKSLLPWKNKTLWKLTLKPKLTAEIEAKKGFSHSLGVSATSYLWTSLPLSVNSRTQPTTLPHSGVLTASCTLKNSCKHLSFAARSPVRADGWSTECCFCSHSWLWLWRWVLYFKYVAEIHHSCLSKRQERWEEGGRMCENSSPVAVSFPSVFWRDMCSVFFFEKKKCPLLNTGNNFPLFHVDLWNCRTPSLHSSL